MGQRNPDRITLQERYHLGKTVELMAKHGWDVISKCAHCELAMQADLATIALISGKDTILWNRKPRCRRLLCGGHVTFWAKAPGMNGHQPLVIDEKVRE